MKRILHLIFCLTLLLTEALAEGPKIGLVLGGGGAKGAAEVGVLKVLVRRSSVRVVLTSMGILSSLSLLMLAVMTVGLLLVTILRLTPLQMITTGPNCLAPRGQVKT